MRRSLHRTAGLSLVLACALVLAGPALGQNLLANPGFEAGLTDWIPFGNAYAESENVPQFVPLGGTGLCSMFGNFNGNFNVTGIFQEFAAAPGDEFTLTANARHWDGDPMVGIGSASCATGCADNWVVQKIAFFDAGNAEIAGFEAEILNGAFATDTWHPGPMTVGVAPANTVKVQALILYLQPGFAGGAAHIDDVLFEMSGPVPTEPTTWGNIKALYSR